MRRVEFSFVYQDKNSSARLGRLKRGNYEIETPAFFPVATQATVKSLSPQELSECGVEGILTNAYHLYLRPGVDIIRHLGGIHKFMHYFGLIITDSGGYQIFSLEGLRRSEDGGVSFTSHIDGSLHFLTPEKVIEIQEAIDSDIWVHLDECLKYPVLFSRARSSLQRTLEWARRSWNKFQRLKETKQMGQMLLGVIQGATYPDLRKQAVEEMLKIGFRHFSLGGLSVGEPFDLRYNIVSRTIAELPSSSLRYLMGVGKPADILEAVECGIDLFDCILPTRLGRSGTAFTSKGRLIIRDARFRRDESPVDRNCSCFVCQNFSRAYLRHLINAQEILAARLLSYHNVFWYENFMSNMREAIKNDSFIKFKKEFLDEYHNQV